MSAAKKKNDLKDRLSRYRQIKVTVIGRKTGQTISNPVWFVLEDEKLYLPSDGPPGSASALCDNLEPSLAGSLDVRTLEAVSREPRQRS